MQKILCLCLVCVLIFGLVACSSNKQIECLYTTHGIYFSIDESHILITPSGKAIVFKTDEKIKFSDGDIIQFNYNSIQETYPEQVVAVNIKDYEDDINLDKIIETMKLLKTEYGFNFNEEIYSSLVPEEIIEDNINEEPIDEKPIEESISQLAKISKILDLLDEGQNTMFSPLSLNFAMTLISEGANDEIKADFETYFGMTFDEYIELYSNYINESTKNLEIANAFYLRDEFTFNEEFVNNEKLNAELSVEKFDEEFINKVNSWCAEKTHSMIPEIITEIPTEDIISIVLNALYFEDEWLVEYEESDIQENSIFNDDIEGVTYLYSEESTYYENDYAIAFSKDYKNDRFSFIGILPKEEGDFTLESLDLDSLVKSETEIETHVLLPEFEFENNHNLVEVLRDIGLESIFKDDAFTNITSENLRVSNIIQKTKIKVDREGTKAAAVTEVDMVTSAVISEPEYKTVELTRPFAFIIYDNIFDLPIFVGKVINPNN